MEKTTLKIHGCWALAFASAFVIGSKFQSSKSQNSLTTTVASERQIAGGASGLAPGGMASSSSTRGSNGAAQTNESAIAGVFGGTSLSGQSMTYLATEALKDPNPVKRRLAFGKLLEGLTSENATSVRDQLIELGAGGQEWRDFNYAWGALGGKEAFDQALLTDRKDLDSLVTGWAAVNPEGAKAILDQLPEDLQKNRGRLEASIVSGLADRDRDEAASYVSELASQGREDAHRLMDIVAGEALRSDGPEAAAAWSQSLPDGPLKGEAMDRIADSYARKDPVAAAGWVEQFATEEYAKEAVEEVGQRWARADPLQAVSWLDELPGGEGQKAGLNSAFADWEDRDPVAAGNYLLSMPPSDKRDSAISGFAHGYAYQDPETSIAWANDISNPELRNSALTRAGQAYFRRNPDSAKSWLASSGLPSEVQQAIQNPPRRRR